VKQASNRLKEDPTVQLIQNLNQPKVSLLKVLGNAYSVFLENKITK